MITLREIAAMEPASITCDRCGCSTKNEPGNFEFAEYLSIKHTCGYGSIIGDGTTLQVDLCQYCVKELLLPFSFITKP
jgi:hypothetical protein